ncbi:Trypsin 3A1 [Pseudolycoriella hygida]|uniref:trypsin n=1 Tax=Pseudolycoriella hygida TaxID=35572 RepID=A0A9Q0ML43_9DIPT|nr:Trypsin 3A1 [Pseudolycoriella hygida]
MSALLQRRIMNLLVFFALFASVFGQEHGGMVPLNSNVGLIVGGEETTIERFPWIVSMQRLGAHFCGGSIISATRILSAAHCTVGIPATSISIRAGSTNNQVGGQFIGVSQVHNHPQYNPATINNDICVVVISTPLNLEPAGVAIVALPIQGAGVPVGAMADVAGWGATCEGCAPTNILRFVTVPVLSNAECNAMYGGLITAGMICAGFPEGGRDACQMDSGGPLTHNNLLIGVVSWGVGCARPNAPGVYARVSHFRTWINGLL